MKKLYFLSVLLTFGLFISCSKEDNNSGGSSVQSITITANPTEAYVGDNIQFTVRGNNNANITSTAVIYVNNSPIVNDFYTTTTAGTLSVYAKYQVSSTVSITSDSHICS